MATKPAAAFADTRPFRCPAIWDIFRFRGTPIERSVTT
jgi:hypothetical protein